MAITAELQKVYASAPVDRTYVETLELKHSAFSKTWYITNSQHAWEMHKDTAMSALVTYEPLSFEAKLPDQNSGGNQELVLAIANAGLDMMQELEAAQTKPEENIECIYRVYLDVPHSVPQIDPPLTLNISDVNADLLMIRATATRFDLLGRQFPKQIYDTENFPGLKR